MSKLLFLLVFVASISFAQDSTSCACCDVQHDQFDFWVGDWIVYDTAGIMAIDQFYRNKLQLLQPFRFYMEPIVGG